MICPTCGRKVSGAHDDCHDIVEGIADSGPQGDCLRAAVAERIRRVVERAAKIAEQRELLAIAYAVADRADEALQIAVLIRALLSESCPWEEPKP